MRLLITGINGFVGGHLAEHLHHNSKYELWGLARTSNITLPSLQGIVLPYAADLLSSEQVFEALNHIKPDIIVHLAGQANVPQSFADPTHTLQTNILGQLNLFQGLLQLKQNPLFIAATSNEIYGYIRPEDLPVGEKTPFRPVNPYAVSKAAQDLLAYQYHISHKLRTIRLRLFNHIGPRQTEQFVASAFAAQIARIEAGLQEPILSVGDLSAERDFTDVRDMARAYQLVIDHGKVGQAYNIGAGRTVSIQWLLDTLLSFSPMNISVKQDPARMRPSDVPRVICDNRQFQQDTGWKPQITLEQSLLDILTFWRKQIQNTQ
jgi:GDP-4-dehydro-6-deoxy-D-mannose reductase